MVSVMSESMKVKRGLVSFSFMCKFYHRYRVNTPLTRPDFFDLSQLRTKKKPGFPGLLSMLRSTETV